MDYEKKDFRKLYEDLVKSDWFKRAYHNKSLGECPFDIPELAESEDERIRKSLLAYIKGESKRLDTPKWIFYLEKQKEPVVDKEGMYYYLGGKFIYCGYPATEENPYDFAMSQQEKQKEQKPVDEQFPPLEGLDSIKTKYYDDGFKNGFDEGVESVKPTEWSEDWREEDIQTRFAFYTYKDDSSELYLSNVFVEEASRNHGFGTKILRAAEKVAETIGATTICLKVKQDSPANAWYRKNGYGYVAFEDGYDWLEKNLEYMKPNKQEWSEEDEDNLHRVIRVLEDNDSDWKELSDWLKSLRPQPKQVWTEEDDRICHLIMANLSESARHAITLPMETVNDFNNWLRTLQYMPPVFTDWNEEDQTLLSDALGCVTMVQELKKRGKLKNFHISCSYDELRSWVRSLKSRPRKQPSWKPSEEQMEALDEYIYAKDPNTEKYSKAVLSLRDELKKLM